MRFLRVDVNCAEHATDNTTYVLVDEQLTGPKEHTYVHETRRTSDSESEDHTNYSFNQLFNQLVQPGYLVDICRKTSTKFDSKVDSLTKF